MHMTTVAGVRTHRRICSWSALVPLAIELGAACSRLLDPNALLRRLADSLHALGLARWTCSSARCSGSTCTVNLTGAQTVDVDPRTDWRSDLQVGPIEPAAVTVSAYGDAARLTPGTAAEVSGLRVELVSVSGSDVSLRVDRA